MSLVPPEALYPPALPSEHITLWQGLTIGIGFLPHALATALEELGLPKIQAIYLYVLTLPLGIFLISSKTCN